MKSFNRRIVVAAAMLASLLVLAGCTATTDKTAPGDRYSVSRPGDPGHTNVNRPITALSGGNR